MFVDQRWALFLTTTPARVIRGCHLIPAFALGKILPLVPYQGEPAVRVPGELKD